MLVLKRPKLLESHTEYPSVDERQSTYVETARKHHAICHNVRSRRENVPALDVEARASFTQGVGTYSFRNFLQANVVTEDCFVTFLPMASSGSECYIPKAILVTGGAGFM